MKSQKMESNRPVEVEFTLTQDGRLDFKSCNGDTEIIYELTRRAREQAEAYRRAQMQTDPLAIVSLGIIGILTLLMCGIFAQIITTRPVPQPPPIHR